MNGDGGVKTFWGTCFTCGEQGHKKNRCPTRKESDKKATAQPQRSSSAIAPPAGVSTGARFRAPSSASYSTKFCQQDALCCCRKTSCVISARLSGNLREGRRAR